MAKETKLIIAVVVLAFAVGVLVVLLVKSNIPRKESIEVPDTTYNHIVLDSIRYNIILRDSIIYHIRHEYEDSIKDIIQLDDSASVVLFKRLAREYD